MSASILLVDDEKVFRLLAEEALEGEGFEVRSADSLRRARALIDKAAPDVLILDRRLPDGDGIGLLKALRAEGASTIVIVVTAYGDVENAVEALKAGATDYLTKPVQLTDLVIKLHKTLETRGLKDRLKLARQGARAGASVEPSSPAMKGVHERLASVAKSSLTPVLMEGESGVGKQRAAELLHDLTWNETDSEAPFVELNCAALPEPLVESELFGHEKGAFTDARSTRRGLIELAAGGTLFLDEVTELPLHSQAKLLKFLDSMRFRRLGGTREIEVELRVVGATNQDVRAAVEKGRLRADLYHRLAVFLVHIPPLRERVADVPDLARSFVSFFAGRLGKRGLTLAEGAMNKLCAYDYPGNVRELRNVVERAVILAQGPAIHEGEILVHHGNALAAASTPAAFFAADLETDGRPPSIDQLERAYVTRILKHTGGHRTAAAQALGISYPTLLKRLRELGLE
jgi:two-component system response regulator AtoC